MLLGCFCFIKGSSVMLFIAMFSCLNISNFNLLYCDWPSEHFLNIPLFRCWWSFSANIIKAGKRLWFTSSFSCKHLPYPESCISEQMCWLLKLRVEHYLAKAFRKDCSHFHALGLGALRRSSWGCQGAVHTANKFSLLLQRQSVWGTVFNTLFVNLHCIEVYVPELLLAV